MAPPWGSWLEPLAIVLAGQGELAAGVREPTQVLGADALNLSAITLQ